MEFEKAMKAAEEYLTFAPRFMDPAAPQGLWFCDSIAEVSAIGINAVCLGSGLDWDCIAKCIPFFEHFPYMVIVSPNAIAREEMVAQLRRRITSITLYVVTDVGFRNCKTIADFIRDYGQSELLAILDGAEELPAYGLLNLATVPRRDMSRLPRTLSRFSLLDASIGGFYAGELSVWTGKRGIGKSTLLSQMLLEAVDQGHVVCAYSGELPKEQFREWVYLQAAGPDHISYITDKATGKRLVSADALADGQISEWLNEKFWLFDLEANTHHNPETIIRQFEYCRKRYGADVFLVDNIMSVDFDSGRTLDFNRAQSEFTRMLVTFSKRNRVHTHLVVHPRKSTSDTNSQVSADDVSGSGDITNRADNVFFLTMHSCDEAGKLAYKPMLKVLKNRDFGSKGQQWLDFDKKARRFFTDRTGDPARPYGWDMAAQQIRIVEEHDEIDSVFPENESERG